MALQKIRRDYFYCWRSHIVWPVLRISVQPQRRCRKLTVEKRKQTWRNGRWKKKMYYNRKQKCCLLVCRSAIYSCCQFIHYRQVLGYFFFLFRQALGRLCIRCHSLPSFFPSHADIHVCQIFLDYIYKMVIQRHSSSCILGSVERRQGTK